MRHLLGRFGFALLVLFLISTKFVDVTIGAGFGSHPAATAWAATGLTAERFALDYWSSTPPPSAVQDPRQLAGKIASRLGVRKPSIYAGETGGIRFANLDGALPGEGEIVLTIQVERRETNIGISCCYGGLPDDLLGLERRIRLAVAGLGAQGAFYWTIRGRLPGRLREETWRAMWTRVLASINAERRGNRPDDDLIEAYTPLLPTAPASGVDGEVNLVLAAQYDPSRRASLIVLASPHIGEEV